MFCRNQATPPLPPPPLSNDSCSCLKFCICKLLQEISCLYFWRAAYICHYPSYKRGKILCLLISVRSERCFPLLNVIVSSHIKTLTILIILRDVRKFLLFGIICRKSFFEIYNFGTFGNPSTNQYACLSFTNFWIDEKTIIEFKMTFTSRN
jgi:hypothetical protein